jgi:hypothetical protein
MRHVRVVIYEWSMTNCIHRLIEVASPRWTIDGGMRYAAREALAILRYEEDDQMEHSLYRHFLSQAREGAEAMVLP